MGLRIEILKFADVEVDSSCRADGCRSPVDATYPIQGYLILGGAEGPILVDTGIRSSQVTQGTRLKSVKPCGGGLEAELAKRGLQTRDIRYIFHTHLHRCHAGKDDIFPASTAVVINRRELEVGCGGLGGSAYSIKDMKHLLDRVQTPNAAWLLDLNQSGPVELLSGIAAEPSGGHTEGSINILVETDGGIACICGDIIHNVCDQILAPAFRRGFREPAIAGCTTLSRASEIAAVKRVLQSGAWILPMHDAPARVAAGGVVIGRVPGIHVPGPVKPLDDRGLVS